jgi:hypothetical protein
VSPVPGEKNRTGVALGDDAHARNDTGAALSVTERHGGVVCRVGRHGRAVSTEVPGGTQQTSEKTPPQVSKISRPRISTPLPGLRPVPVAPSGQHNGAVRGHDRTAALNPRLSLGGHPEELRAAVFVLVTVREMPYSPRRPGVRAIVRHLSQSAPLRPHRQQIVDRASQAARACLPNHSAGVVAPRRTPRGVVVAAGPTTGPATPRTTQALRCAHLDTTPLGMGLRDTL